MRLFISKYVAVDNIVSICLYCIYTPIIFWISTRNNLKTEIITENRFLIGKIYKLLLVNVM